jgi:putative tryptophan/tyrosine transport system substrate-binding protein
MKKSSVRSIAFLVLSFATLVPGLVGWSHAKEIAVIWDTKSAMVTNVVMGFLPAIKQIAPDLQVTLYRELKDMEEAKRVFHEQESKVDGIVFLRSSGAEYLAKVDPKVPCFVGASNNPSELGVIKNLNAPEGKVTGVTYFIPYSKRFDIIKSLFPDIRSVALLVEKGHPSGPIEQAGTRKECEKLGISYKEVVASSLPELLEKTKSLGKVDLYIITNTRLIMDNIVNLLPIANSSKTPMFSYADKPVKSGAVAGVAADDTKLGAMLAESVVDVVVKGKAISSVPVKMDPDPKITINENMMRGLDLKFPDEILQKAQMVR